MREEGCGHTLRANDKRIYVDAGVSGFGQTLDKTKILRTQTEQNWTL